MSIVRYLVLFVLLYPIEICAQKTSVLFTYSQSVFIVSPGLEVNYFFHPKIGLQAGISTYFINYKPEQMVNASSKRNYFFEFYNSNIGICGIFLNYDKIKIGGTVGWKMYYGPHFIPLHYFEEQEYYIYYDAANGKFNHGVDLGLLSYVNQTVFGVKFDTARNVFRALLGWSF